MSELTTTVPPSEPEVLESDRLVALGDRGLRRHTARGTLINSGFQIGFSLIGLLRQVAVAIFLTASEFGFWGLIVATLLTLGWLKQIGISDKYVQQDEADQEVAFQRAFTLELAYTGVFYLLVVALLPVYALIYGRPEILLPGFVLSLAFLASALQSPIWIAYRQMRFVKQRTIEAIDPVVTTVVTIGLAAAGAGYWSLVIGALAGTSASAAAALATCPYKLAWDFDRDTLREYVGFSAPLLVWGLSSLVMVQGAVIVGNASFGLAGLGAMGIAQSFAFFADRVDQVIRQTVYPAICAVADRRDLLLETFVKTNQLAVMWGVPFGIGLALFAPDLITYVLGERWRLAEGVLQAFGLIIGFRQIGFNWSIFYRAIGETKPIAVNAVVITIGFLAVTVPLMLSIGLDGYALGMAIVLLFDLASRAFYLARLFPGFNLLTHALRAVVPSLPALAFVLALRVGADVERSLAYVLAELAIYVALNLLVAWRFERTLLTEMSGYLRAPRPA